MSNDIVKCNTLVVKVASRCNLNCTYCYMYNLGDNSWKQQPKRMSIQTINDLSIRINEHCKAHASPKRMNIVLHGGEPLLAGMDFFESFVGILRQNIDKDIRVKFMVQTNGTLLTDEWCSLFDKLGIVLGISLDGTKEDNDKFRIYHSGKGSYDDIIKGYTIAKSSPYLQKKPGMLSVLNVNANPIETYQHFKDIGVTVIDFLLPEANLVNRPPTNTAHFSVSPYADWLITLFDKWILEDKNEKVGIRIFEILIELILGNDISYETFGKMHNDVLVIETDGGIEAVDALKICGDGFTKAGANVKTHSFNFAMETPLAKLYGAAHENLPQKCMTCPINEVCGGGPVQTRYNGIDFNNESVYCEDFLKLITHIQNTIYDNLPLDVIEVSGVEKLDYLEARELRDNNPVLMA